MISGEKYRITVITDRLIRFEYDEEGLFTDACTALVHNRDFPEVLYTQNREQGEMTIRTGALCIRYDGKPFSSQGLSVEMVGTGKVWHYSIPHGNADRNFGGTARTLDGADGRIPLENGIFGEYGYGILDDSGSPLLVEGEFQKRISKETDLYFFGYGKDYREGLRDFFSLTGNVPMIPRYALGNWWSRYHRYTEDSYLDLLQNFEKEKIPLSVAVIDMDWHLTQVDPKYGSGWTGYTWDPECFPDPERFLKELKKRGMAITLNLHPADGIRGFEKAYPKVAKRLGLDADLEEPAAFDLEDRNFREAYFEEVLHPMEEMGVDFWWIDWQQGTGKKEGDIDPLLLLNHYHFEDQRAAGKRPMIFSRYAGPGSHRYPVGFSGDTIMSWESLKFQPFFTSNAANIGYGWWSHDIGGHMMGSKDEERLIRWIEFGVFSPVMRLHSSNSPFFNKEPWTLEEPYRTICGDFLRLRHRLLPYLYTMNYVSHTLGRVLCEPMYYAYPEKEQAYRVPGEYTFGTQLLVGAVTEKEDPMLRMAPVYMYLPEGRWYDLFTGRIYSHEGCRNLYRSIRNIPVLMPAGGILPLQGWNETSGREWADHLQILLGMGADGDFTLYEDDGSAEACEKGAFAATKLSMEYRRDTKQTVVHVVPPEGETALLPEERSYEILLYGAKPIPGARVEICIGNGNGGREEELHSLEFCHEPEKKRIRISVPKTPVTRKITLLCSGMEQAQNDLTDEVFKIMDRAYCETMLKETVYDAARKAGDPSAFDAWLKEADLPPTLKDALAEVLL